MMDFAPEYSNSFCQKRVFTPAHETNWLLQHLGIYPNGYYNYRKHRKNANHSKRYNCYIIDLFDRRVVASVNSRRIDTQLAIDILTKALVNAAGETGIILHSERGSQFTFKEFL
ncbi:MAG: transposase family protein [Lentisphaerae bacterium]|nr:transposase family protein [Lentisphaerota bacterium]